MIGQAKVIMMYKWKDVSYRKHNKHQHNICKTYSWEKWHIVRIKDHITEWTNEYIMCEAIKTTNDRSLNMNYKQRLWTKLDSTKQNNSDELKTGLNKMEMTLMTTMIKMKNALSCAAVKWCTHVDCSKSSTQNILKYHMTISTINIQINILKTRRMRNCMWCVGRGLVVTLGPDKFTNPKSIKSCIAWWSAK